MSDDCLTAQSMAEVAGTGAINICLEYGEGSGECKGAEQLRDKLEEHAANVCAANPPAPVIPPPVDPTPLD